MNEVAMSSPPRHPWLKKLFPSKWVDLPEAPAQFKDVMFINSTWVLDWKDRLRVLISGRVEMRAKVVCQNEVGDSRAASEFWAIDPFE